MDKGIKIDYKVVKTASELEDIAKHFSNEKIIGVDLEADSLHHFKEKVCLIQISSDKQNFVIDPLPLQDISPLKPVFANAAIKKVFHGADYDIRSLHRDFGIEINNLFDTQLACMFLGIRATGLDAVLQTNFNVSLDKRYQKKDWSVRPLPPEMMDYAALDSAYLPALADTVEKKLAKKGRLAWVCEECEYLSKVRFESNNGASLYLKFKGAGRLEPESLAVLEALLQLRKNIAQKKDRPLFKIFSNKSIMNITFEKPCNLSQLKANGRLSKKQVQMYGKTIISTVAAALEIPAANRPGYPNKKVPVQDPAVPQKIKVLKDWRDNVSAKLGIDPGILISNAVIHAIIKEKPETMIDLKKIECLKNWRRKEFGEEILSTLNA
ncbi:MAG: ribonuclease D [Desulfosarcina sp.]|nr:ribonuclease D [Desulfobacterales bacterium]